MNNDKADVRLEDVEGTKAELDRKARKMLEDKDADSRMRIYDGPLGKAIVVLSSCISPPSAPSAPLIYGLFTVFSFWYLPFFYFLPIRRRSGGERCRLCGTGSLSLVLPGLSCT